MCGVCMYINVNFVCARDLSGSAGLLPLCLLSCVSCLRRRAARRAVGSLYIERACRLGVLEAHNYMALGPGYSNAGRGADGSPSSSGGLNISRLAAAVGSCGSVGRLGAAAAAAAAALAAARMLREAPISTTPTYSCGGRGEGVHCGGVAIQRFATVDTPPRSAARDVPAAMQARRRRGRWQQTAWGCSLVSTLCRSSTPSAQRWCRGG